MAALGYAMATSTLQGWRIWRVLPFERLDGTRAVRLCAVGTYGIPKLWEPRRPTVAVCSSFTSDHEAPWVEHECGIWALKRPEDARRRMVSWMQTQGEPLGWACGQVSLWGRVIEHEHGWRAQYAYPYAITVESVDGNVAAALRAEYAVDVDWNGAELYEAALAKRRANEEAEESKRAAERAETERLRKKTKAAIARLGARTPTPSAADRLATQEEQRAREDQEREEAIRSMPALPELTDPLSVDEVLVAVVAHVVGWHQAYAAWRRQAPWFTEPEASDEDRMSEARLLDSPADSVTKCVLYARGEEPPFWAYPKAERRGLREARAAVLRAMREARDAGYLDYGLPFESRNGSPGRKYWFITRRGLNRVSRSAASATAPYYDYRNDEHHRHEVDLARAVRLLRRHPRPPFVEEVEPLIPTWMEERRAARRRGRRAYREWLQERRATGRAEMLWFTDDEVEAAVRRMREPVRQVDVMKVLAPADRPGDRLKGETARMSVQLVRLHRNGRLSRRKKGSVIWWEAASA